MLTVLYYVQIPQIRAVGREDIKTQTSTMETASITVYLSFRFEGASGPIIMWVVIFTALVGGIKVLWSWHTTRRPKAFQPFGPAPDSQTFGSVSARRVANLRTGFD